MSQTALKQLVSEHVSKHKNRIISAIENNQATIPFNYDDLCGLGPDFITEMDKNPSEVMGLLSEVIKDVVSAVFPDKKVNPRAVIVNLPSLVDNIGSIPLRQLRTEHYQKYISLAGISNDVTQVAPLVAEEVYSCQDAGHILSRARDNFFEEFFPKNLPFKCEVAGCSGKILRSQKDDKHKDEQVLSIQETPQITRGAEAYKVYTVLHGDQIDKVKIMDGCKVYGFVRIAPRKKGTESLFYIDGAYIEATGKTWKEVHVSSEVAEKCKGLVADDPKIVDNMAESLVPFVLGHHILKKAVLLQQIRGVKKTLPDGTITRDVSHILVVGDAGVGKTAMMRKISELVPGAVYVSAEGATAAAVTAAAVPHPLTKEWRLSAGAIPMASGSAALIDEFEKADEDVREGLREAMESQTISIHKASIHARLDADTSCLCASNPRGGRLNDTDPLSRQLLFDPTLLSRFDVIFVIRDRPEPQKDRAMAQHILSIHRGEYESEVAKLPKYDGRTVLEYIAWCRTLRPRLSTDATKYIENFYASLRGLATGPDMPIPIGVRQIEGLIRFAEAHAKSRGSEVVTQEDAEISISILKESLRQAGIDTTTGVLDIDLFEGRVPKTQRDRLIMVDRYFSESDPNKEGIDETKVSEDLSRLGLKEPIRLLDELSQTRPVLYLKKGGKWRKV